LELEVFNLFIEILTETLNIGYSTPEVEYDKSDECPICLGGMKNQKLPMSCGHWCHKNCMEEWNTRTSKNTCPVCKATDISFV